MKMDFENNFMNDRASGMYMGLALSKEQRIEYESTDYSVRKGRQQAQQFRLKVTRNGKIAEESENGMVA